MDDVIATERRSFICALFRKKTSLEWKDSYHRSPDQVAYFFVISLAEIVLESVESDGVGCV